MTAAIATAVVALAGPPPAAAQAVPDASCPGPSDNHFFANTTTMRFAQTFTVENSGALTRADFEIIGGASGFDYVVQIVEVDGSGTPTNTALASTTVADSSVPPGASTVSAHFATPASVAAGQRYALVLSRPGTDDWGVRMRSGDVCPGALFISAMPADPFTEPYPVGVDLVFTVFVEPPTEPEPQVAGKADGTLTIDANKGKVEKGRKVTLSGQLDVAVNEACEPNRTIQIQRRLKSEDDSKFQTFTTVQTDATGNYSLRVKVKKTYFYRAVVGETDTCDDETSNTQKVRVQKKKAAQEA